MERKLRCSEKLEGSSSLQLYSLNKDMATKFSSQLNHLFDSDKLTIDTMLDSFEYFFEGSPDKKIAKIKTWLNLEEDNQVKFLSRIPRGPRSVLHFF